MKSIRQALLACVFMCAAGAMVPAHAAADAASKEGKPAAKDLVLKGDAKCTACHDEADSPELLQIGRSRHGVKADQRAPTCTSCHGESTAHVDYKGKDKPPKPDRWFGKRSTTSADERAGACLACHEKEQARLHWAGSQHQRTDVPCTSCHQIHTQRDKVLSKATQKDVCFSCHKTERAQSLHISTHPINAGKVACSDCHNPHGSAGPKLVKEENVRDTCFTCHAEKRGPFLHEHASAMDDCMNCHTPHGSTNASLLKGRMPWLCQECHSDSAPHPGGVYSGNNLPGGAQANANMTGGLRNPLGSGATFNAPTALNQRNPVTGLPVTAGAGSPQIMMRGCVNCHSQIHGSNHPGGQRFTR